MNRAPRCQAIQVRSLKRTVPVGSKVAVAQIVGKEEHEVWPIGSVSNVCDGGYESQE